MPIQVAEYAFAGAFAWDGCTVGTVHDAPIPVNCEPVSTYPDQFWLCAADASRWPREPRRLVASAGSECGTELASGRGRPQRIDLAGEG
jgi:hypothetical protein